MAIFCQKVGKVGKVSVEPNDRMIKTAIVALARIMSYLPEVSDAMIYKAIVRLMLNCLAS